MPSSILTSEILPFPHLPLVPFPSPPPPIVAQYKEVEEEGGKVGDRENPSQMPTERTTDRRTRADLKKWEIPSPFFAEKKNWAKKPSQLFFFFVYRDWKDAPTKPRSEKALFSGCSSAASFSPPLVRPTTDDANAKRRRRGGNGVGREGKQE